MGTHHTENFNGHIKIWFDVLSVKTKQKSLKIQSHMITNVQAIINFTDYKNQMWQVPIIKLHLQSEFVREDQKVSFSGIICWQHPWTVELMWAMLNDTDKVKHTKICQDNKNDNKSTNWE